MVVTFASRRAVVPSVYSVVSLERRNVMTTSPEVGHSGSGKARMRAGWSVVGWLLGILGGVSLFVGLFAMFGNESASIGVGGDLSWQVSEITDAWVYGLLIGGGVALVLALGIALFAPRHEETEVSDVAELIWHGSAFVLVNAFVWMQDIAIGGGVDYAYWLTIPWGIGLAIHALAVYRNHRPGGPRHLGEPQPH